MTETHPFEPFFPPKAKILICGTFPATEARWCMRFYYPNFQNDMWRVFGIIFFNDRDHFVDTANKTYRLDELKEFLTRRGIAFSDTGREIIRTTGNASDKDLKIVEHIDLPTVLEQLPELTDIVTTGKLAAEVIAGITDSSVPQMGEFTTVRITDASGHARVLRHWRMPSTSRAYPLSALKKADMYRRVLDP